MALTEERLREIVVELIGRPGHEKVRALIYSLLVDGLGVQSREVDFERRLPEVRGRTDALLGLTVLEFKSDLRAEMGDVMARLPDYLSDRERETKQRFVGIATDGHDFMPFQLRAGQLIALAPYRPTRDHPRELLAWLDRAVSREAEIQPLPELVRNELGRDSLAYQVAESYLAAAWETVKEHPDVTIKRQLWANLLEVVYGSSVDQDQLFFQHTYLTVVAEAMATRVLGVELPAPAELLAGKPFHDAGINGAVESDFFDWILEAPTGAEVVNRICGQATRFRLDNVQHDVLKGLYESLIDPTQRHDLGEYYTPDWLAAKMCDHVITDPLAQRVLDPSCGSGTFLFHAVRRVLKAAADAKLSNGDALLACTQKVIGVDIHPVAAIISRVTYLLALGEDRLKGDRPALSIPVYLGDSMQWNTEAVLVARTVRIEVPEGPSLHFPWSVTQDPAAFDAVVGAMLEMSSRQVKPKTFRDWLDQANVGDRLDRELLTATYDGIRQLQEEGRNHIWGYVARNLARPIWLSGDDQKTDVIIGNPPWLAYRYMAPSLQAKFRQECQRLGVWAGGHVTNIQDLSGYFFARMTELYLSADGSIAMVMPYAAMTRPQFEGFRTGRYSSLVRARPSRGRPASRAPRLSRSEEVVFATLRFLDAWVFDDSVQPLFGVPSCVLFAKPEAPGALPTTVTSFSGLLPRRDADLDQANNTLSSRTVGWPSIGVSASSAYHELFRDGATMYPRVLCMVDRVAPGRFGGDAAAPVVQSHRSPLEKAPWKSVKTLRGPVESRFLRPIYLGESIAPFRGLIPLTCIAPWTGESELLDSSTAARGGFRHLARWLREAEAIWSRLARTSASLTAQLDYYGKLSTQLRSPAPIRVVYSNSGTLPAAAILRDSHAITDVTLFWAPVAEDEAYYLASLLNSESLRKRVEGLQSRGQWGARHFAKLLVNVAIPKYDTQTTEHRQLSSLGLAAEKLAAAVPLPDGGFVRKRRIIREALIASGISGEIDRIAEAILPSLSG